MDVQVTGHQVDIADVLREHAVERIQGLADKYFSRAVGANVTFGQGPQNDFTCDIIAPVSRGIVLKAQNRAGQARLAFEGAADKIEKQLRRYAGRLREHKAEPVDEIVSNAGYTVLQAPREVEQPPANPPVVAETRVDIPEASVSDAVMLMDLRNTGALMFKNSASGEYNMIYRRDDGTIGWVEPQAS